MSLESWSPEPQEVGRRLVGAWRKPGWPGVKYLLPTVELEQRRPFHRLFSKDLLVRAVPRLNQAFGQFDQFATGPFDVIHLGRAPNRVAFGFYYSYEQVGVLIICKLPSHGASRLFPEQAVERASPVSDRCIDE